MTHYQRTEHIHACTLSKEDLQGFIELIKENFPHSERETSLRVETDSEEAHIQEDCVNKFLDAQGLPEVIKDLTIEFFGEDEFHNFRNSVTVRFKDKNIELQVRGTRRQWVIDKHRSITAYLKTRRSWFYFFSEMPLWLSFIVVGVMPFTFSILLAHYIVAGDVFFAWATGIFLFTGALLTLLYRTGVIMTYSEIYVCRKPPLFTLQNVLFAVFAASFAVSLAGSVITVFV